jgi:hypothetical protein
MPVAKDPFMHRPSSGIEGKTAERFRKYEGFEVEKRDVGAEFETASRALPQSRFFGRRLSSFISIRVGYLVCVASSRVEKRWFQVGSVLIQKPPSVRGEAG